MQQQPEMMAVASRQIPLMGAASTLIGGRQENQDNLTWCDTPLGFAVVVCDGMGGGPGGRTASAIAVTTVVHTLAEAGSDADRATTLRRAVALAEEAIEAQMRADRSLQGMGTTLVAMLINKQSAMIAHLGDSRCYRFHGGTMLFRTHDHSLVAELVQNKALTEEQARTSPQSNVITRGLGSTTNHVAEIEEIPYRTGDRFVLCTDGIWGIMPHDKLLQHLGVQLPPATIVANLQKEVDRIGASSGGGHDNHTLVILQTGADSILKDKMSKQIKIIIATLTACLLVSIVLNATLMLHPRIQTDTTELERAQNELANSQLESSTAARISEQTLKDNTIQIVQLKQAVSNLEQDAEAWENAYDEMLGLKDSLQNKLNEAQKEIAQLKKTEWPKPVAVSGKTTPKTMAEQIMKELHAMRDCRAKDGWATASGKQAASRRNLNKLLRDLNYATDKVYDREIGDILIGLKDEDILRIDAKTDKKGYFHPTGYALNIIERIIKKFETIQNKINKQ